MTTKEIERQCRLIRKAGKEICSSKRKARAFLRKLYKECGCEYLLKKEK